MGRPPKPRRDLALLLALVGLIGGIALAAATPPHPNCDAGDGSCKLQKVYAAQATKVVGGLVLGFVIGEYFFVIRRRRRAETVREAGVVAQLRASGIAAPEPTVPEIDPLAVRGLLKDIGDGASLPPAALSAAAKAPPPVTARRTAPLTDEQRKTLRAMSIPLGAPEPGAEPRPRSMRDVLMAQLDEPTGLPTAALEAARGARPAQ